MQKSRIIEVGMPFPVPVPYFSTDFINFFPFLSRSVFFFISLSSFLVIPFIMIMTKAEKHIQRMFAGFFGTGNFAMRLFPYVLNIIKADNLHIRVRFLPPPIPLYINSLRKNISILCQAAYEALPVPVCRLRCFRSLAIQKIWIR